MAMLKNLTLALFLLAAGCVTAAFAADDTAADKLEASLRFQHGKITVQNGLASLNLPANFRYLDPDQTERVLVEGWGNPPGNKTLGMIVPAEVSLMSREGWGVIVTYEEDGHVPDSDADAIKYDELLKEMQESILSENAARKKQGYPAMSLVGWAETPSYDKASHKLYWAKELKTEGAPDSGLNYNVRVLGRKGVLVLNAVANMEQITQIRREMRTVTAFSDFDAGNRYADFNSSTDKTAEYGLAALVAGGAAAKLGLFGKLFALLLAFKKVLIIGIGALGVMIAKLLRGRGEPAPDRAPEHVAAPAPEQVGDNTSGKVNLDK